MNDHDSGNGGDRPSMADLDRALRSIGNADVFRTDLGRKTLRDRCPRCGGRGLTERGGLVVVKITADGAPAAWRCELCQGQGLLPGQA